MIRVLLFCLTLRSLVKSSNLANTYCQEYASAVYSQEDSPLLMRRTTLHKVSQCGIVSVPLIIGGMKAQPMEFPHMAVIGFGETHNSKVSWECGGALISDLYILTAAHCLHSRASGPSQKIKLGTININDNSEQVQERLVVRRIPHPNYKRFSKYNDIALLQMEFPVRFTAYIRPACLNQNENIDAPGKEAVASGFGKTSFEATETSKDLMKVSLSLYTRDVCVRGFGPKTMSTLREGIVSTMICAGLLSGGKDTCQGDSGGPLQVVLESPYCMYSVIGVTSFGKFCGFANSPAIYTKVSSFVPWIESIVWG